MSENIELIEQLANKLNSESVDLYKNLYNIPNVDYYENLYDKQSNKTNNLNNHIFNKLEDKLENNLEDKLEEKNSDKLDKLVTELLESDFNDRNINFYDPNIKLILNLEDSSILSIYNQHLTDYNSNIENLEIKDLKRLNKKQNQARKDIFNFIKGTELNHLLLGPAGTGKSTVIVNTFNDTKFKIIFCAFTNKATQVLKKISKKTEITFNPEFNTIHKLLGLEIEYCDDELDIKFNFKKEKIEGLAKYDIIIFDECSTISKELYKYIYITQKTLLYKCRKIVKFIFLGDYWQLPPVNEQDSVIFENIETMEEIDRWSFSKLNKVMRSNNEEMTEINNTMIQWIKEFCKAKSDKIYNKFLYSYPQCLIGDDNYINKFKLASLFVKTMNTIQDTIVITYSRVNAIETNISIQELLDKKNNRPYVNRKDNPKIIFNTGDRCCIDRLIDLRHIEYISNDTIRLVPKVNTSNNHLLNEVSNLYPGDIYNIVQAVDIKIKTTMNYLPYMPEYFEGQLLTIQKIGDDQLIYIPNIDHNQINSLKNMIRKKETRSIYIEIMKDIVMTFPKLLYGYCITLYKSQGSEWHTVFVNLLSIKYSIIRQDDASVDKIIQLFKATYTAISRASDKVYCIYNNFN